MDVKVLYEDKNLIVVVKPAGMPSQGDRSSTLDMVSYLKNYLRSSANGIPYVGVVHRLDRPVGGVMVYAKDQKTAADLSLQVQKKQLCKMYKVVLTGTLKNKQGTLENYLLKDGKTNTSSVVSKNTPGAKPARLNYKVMRTKYVDQEQLTLAEIELITGRHHQIRVQMADAGAGVYGDTKYNPVFQGKKGWFKMGLFSCRLEFKHPVTKEKLAFEYEPEEEPFDLI